jgi:hypothetical protein
MAVTVGWVHGIKFQCQVIEMERVSELLDGVEEGGCTFLDHQREKIKYKYTNKPVWDTKSK